MHWLELTVDRFGHGPDAVGRADDGRVVFVRGAVPGDTVRVRITETHERWLKGEVDRIVTPSPHRREVPCSHHVDDRCGGCPWIGATIECQRQEKHAVVVREIGRISAVATVTPLRTDLPEWGYRRRTRLGYRGDIVGFRRRAERRVFALEHCAVLDNRLNAALPDVRETVAGRRGKHRSGNLDVALDSAGEVMIGGGATVFQQPSATTEAVLIELVLDAVSDHTAVLAELFAGGGTFTEPLAATGLTIAAWEVDRRSVDALSARCPDVAVHRLDLFRDTDALDLGVADTVLLDPPRAGAKECMPAIIRSEASRVIYVSCELATLCRDLRTLTEAGFTIDRVTPIDAFPQTPHIECVAVLTRPAPKSSVT